MLDIKFIRENTDKVKEAIKKYYKGLLLDIEEITKLINEEIKE